MPAILSKAAVWAGFAPAITNRSILAFAIVGALALPLITETSQPAPGARPRYKLIDLGTLGGPASSVASGTQIVNEKGTVIGGANTPELDPFEPNCYNANCFVSHAFQWQKGILTDLGTLPGGAISDAIAINAREDIIGLAQTGLIDPLTGTPEVRAVLWRNHEIVNLGTLGGNESFASAVNNRGQVVGAAANAILDPFSLSSIQGGPASATQTRAFLWENGVMGDLGTLGGPDSFAWFVNERGQVTGVSYTDSTPTETTGIPAIHPFLWENGRMRDLGSLGGAFATVESFNKHGEVTGLMTLPGDEVYHPYLWDGATLRDLGTFGGSTGEATGLNDAGEVVGQADFPGDILHNAFLWKNGALRDLGNLGISSSAHGINSRGQVVGASRVSLVPSQASAFLWEDGGPMVDLNNLIPANSSLHLVFAEHINDRGEIVGKGVPPGVPFEDIDSRGHAFLLIPTGE